MLLPWQQWLLIHMLELLPDNTLRFRTVLVLVGRQNGKSTLSQVLALWFMYVYNVALVIGTAQDLDVAEEIWQGAIDMVTEVDDETEQPVRPELYRMVGKVNQTNGKKSMRLTTGERWKVKAANRRAGRSLTANLVLLDELREHQSWEAWSAISKTIIAVAQALILALSNAGDSSSVVLRHLRLEAHRMLDDPDGIVAAAEAGPEPTEDLDDEDDDEPYDEWDDDDEDDVDDTLAIFEWSAAPGRAKRDRDGWAEANPSMGYTGLTERTIKSALSDPEWVFRTEVLCQWPEGTLDGPFPPNAWETCRDEESRRNPASEITLGLDVSWDRTTSYVAMAGWREDGDVHGELIAQRAGVDWIIPWFTDPKRSAAVKAAPVAVQAKGAPVSGLIEDMRAAGINVVEWGGSDLAGGCGQMYDRVAGTEESEDEDGNRTAAVPPTFHHTGKHPALNEAAGATTTKRSGDSWFWDRTRSPVDAAPLIAQTGAVWLLGKPKPKPAPQPRVRVIGGRV